LIGTYLDEAEYEGRRDNTTSSKQKYLPSYQQTVTDAKGKRRFHGAFTGGWSAGYFNTCGSQEGWAPSTFKSSRGNRVDLNEFKQSIDDFLDDQDLQDGVASGKKLVATAEFQKLGDIRDKTPLSLLESVPASERYGLGYEPSAEIQRNKLVQRPNDRNIDSIYQREDMSQYDTVLEDEPNDAPQQTRMRTKQSPFEGNVDDVRRCSDGSRPLEGFVLAKETRLQDYKWFSPPEIPKDYQPVHHFFTTLYTSAPERRPDSARSASWDRCKGLTHMDRAAQLFPSSMASRFVKASDENHSAPSEQKEATQKTENLNITTVLTEPIRLLEDWFPERLLCKRFNIQPPQGTLRGSAAG